MALPLGTWTGPTALRLSNGAPWVRTMSCNSRKSLLSRSVKNITIEYMVGNNCKSQNSRTYFYVS